MHSPISSPNAISPEIMTAAERLDEIGAILAAGILRLRRQQNVKAAIAADNASRALPRSSSVAARLLPAACRTIRKP